MRDDANTATVFVIIATAYATNPDQWHTVARITPTMATVAASMATAMAAATIPTIAAGTTTWGLMADVGGIDNSGVDGGGQQRGRQPG